MRLPLFQIDAFTSEVFRGNPAAVCPLSAWLPEATLQSIAAENNLPETAFLAPTDNLADYEIRWFTPEVEVDLCGHATLAAAWVVFERLRPELATVRLATLQHGVLTVSRADNGALRMDFPIMESRPCNGPAAAEMLDAVTASLGARPLELLRGRDCLAVFPNEEDVAALNPNLSRMADLDCFGVIATAPGHPGKDVDFVSRFFAPGAGIPEDPVTGSAHCALAPFWSERLDKRTLSARQISRRGGELSCEITDERVLLSGRCALYLEGEIIIPA